MTRLLTASDVSELLHVSLSLVYTEIRQGRMSHVRIADGTIRVTEAHLEAYVAAREVLACSPTKSQRTAKRAPRAPSRFRHIDVSRQLGKRK
jgi:excisionase family DNA binding protein